MRSRILVSLILILMGCSSARVGERSPATDDSQDWQNTEESLSAEYDRLMSSPDPSREILKSANTLISIYYRAESQLRLFDSELDGASSSRQRLDSIAKLNSYPKLMAYWQVGQQALEQIVYIYGRLLNTRTSYPRLSDEYEKSDAALSALTDFARKARGSDRLALQLLATELKPIYEKYADRAVRAHEAKPPGDPRPLLFETPDALTDFVKRSDVRTEIDTKLRTKDLSNDVRIENSVERLSATLKAEFQRAETGNREPQAKALRFFPSAGSHGTIGGSEYPAGTWSITFDDGPSAKYSPSVLKNLQDHGFEATFFELAENVKANPQVSLDFLNAGMEMANHSYTHPQLPKVSDAELEREIGGAAKLEAQVWGSQSRPKLFRCPYGAGLKNSRVRTSIAKHGMIHVFWNVDTLDWHDKNPESILARAQKEMRLMRGGIILFHDIHPQSVEASRLLMDWMKEQGIRPKTVGGVIDELNREQGLR